MCWSDVLTVAWMVMILSDQSVVSTPASIIGSSTEVRLSRVGHHAVQKGHEIKVIRAGQSGP